MKRIKRSSHSPSYLGVNEMPFFQALIGLAGFRVASGSDLREGICVTSGSAK